MADALNTPLDPRTVSTLLAALFQQRLQQQDPLRQAQVQAAQQELAEKQRQAEAFRALENTRLPEAPGPIIGQQYGGTTGRFEPSMDDRTGKQALDFEGQPISHPEVIMNPVRGPAPQQSISNVGQLAALIQGLKGVPGTTAQALIARLTGIDPNQDALGKEKELAQFKHGLGSGERDQKQQLQQAKLQALVERYQALQQQAEQRQLMDMQKQQLAQQAEQRRGSTAQNPAAPFATALKEIEAAAKGGADAQTLQAMIEGMGYQPTGSKRVGGFLGMGGTQVPTIGLRRPQVGSAPQQSGTQARVVVQKDGKRASLPVGQLEEAQKQGWTLVQ